MKMLLEFDYKKATQAINFLAIKEGGEIGKLKLIKLIYLADRYHLRKYGRPITNDTYFAMTYGPVASSVKDIAEMSDFLAPEETKYAKKYIGSGKNPHKVVSLHDVNDDVFSESDIEALEFAYKEFGELSASSLVNTSHKYPEWSKHEAILKREATRQPMTYVDFFDNPAEGKDVFTDSAEVLEASKELFEDKYRVAEHWL